MAKLFWSAYPDQDQPKKQHQDICTAQQHTDKSALCMPVFVLLGFGCIFQRVRYQSMHQSTKPIAELYYTLMFDIQSYGDLGSPEEEGM